MSIKKILPAYRYGLSATPSDSQPEKASATFLKGAVVVVDGSGYIAEAGVNPVDIVGIADSPASNDSVAGRSLTRFTPAIGDVVFEGTLSDDAGTYALLQADLFAKYGLTKDATTGFWYVDQAKTAANARVVIVGFRDAVATVQARVYFIVLQSQTVRN